MKNKMLLIVVTALVVYACNKKNTTVDTNINKPDYHSFADYGLDSPFLHPDTANVMIQSYLADRGSNTTQLKSLIVDANALRYYLQNANITKVKLMFAHRLDYVQNNAGNPYDDMDYRALTIVIAGFDNNNNYIYSPQGAVMDHCLPCPADCPAGGTAAYDILTSN